LTAPPVLRVLVVDDDAFSRKLLVDAVTRCGLQATGLAHARDALSEVLGEASPTVILCDLAMPDMDGIQFIEALGSARWRGGVILITGEGARLLQAATKLGRALKLNVLGSLPKPIDPEKLVDLLGRMHKTPQWAEALQRNGWTDAFAPGDQFKTFLENENKRVATVLKDLGLA